MPTHGIGAAAVGRSSNLQLAGSDPAAAPVPREAGDPPMRYVLLVVATLLAPLVGVVVPFLIEHDRDDLVR